MKNKLQISPVEEFLQFQSLAKLSSLQKLRGRWREIPIVDISKARPSIAWVAMQSKILYSAEYEALQPISILIKRIELNYSRS